MQLQSAEVASRFSRSTTYKNCTRYVVASNSLALLDNIEKRTLFQNPVKAHLKLLW
jgi:hypothetical protein